MEKSFGWSWPQALVKWVLGEPQLPDPRIHQVHKTRLTAGNVRRQGMAGIVRGAEERGRKQINHREFISGPEAQPGARLSAGLTRNRDHILHAGFFKHEQSGHDLGQARGGQRAVGVMCPYLIFINFNQI